MKVILLNNSKLGKVGEIVTVKNGYARNCLFPRSIALPATKDNQLKFEQIKKELENKKFASLSIFNQVAAKLTDVTFKFIQKASDEGKLFGSINAKMIAKVLSDKVSLELKMQNFKINHFNIFIPNAIKECGLFHVFYGSEEKFRFFVSVGRTESEAEKYSLQSIENEVNFDVNKDNQNASNELLLQEVNKDNSVVLSA